MTYKNGALPRCGGLLSRSLRLDWRPMPAEENFSLRQDDRVVRLFAARGKELGGAPTDASRSKGASQFGLDGGRADGPSSATIPRAQQPDGASAIASRLDAALESRLREPLSRIATLATVLKHELDDDHADQIEAMVRAATRADSMLS